MAATHVHNVDIRYIALSVKAATSKAGDLAILALLPVSRITDEFSMIYIYINPVPRKTNITLDHIYGIETKTHCQSFIDRRKNTNFLRKVEYVN